METCKESLSEDLTLADWTLLDPSQLCTLLEFYLTNTYFTFDSKLYKRNKELLWGTNVSDGRKPGDGDTISSSRVQTPHQN